MKDDQQTHHRRSVRLPVFDYSTPGAYYVTPVTQNRLCLFGEVREGEVRFSERGAVPAECWRRIPDHFPEVELGAYVVMPNHVHGIIVLHDRADAAASARRGTPWRAPTVPKRDGIEEFGKPAPGSLATIIRQHNPSVTRKIVQQLGGAPRIWQRSYYEHVIRDTADHQRIHLYVVSNIVNWLTDEENVAVSS